MKKYFVLVMVLIGLAKLALGAMYVAPPTGYVEALQLRSTMWGMQQAAGQAPGTMLFMKDQVVVFLWTVKDAWAFTGVSFSGMPEAVDMATKISKGNLVDARTMSDVARYLGTLGFSQIAPSQLPPGVREVLTGGGGWLAGMSNSMVTILVVPVGIFTLPEEYQSYDG